ncbi:MAG: hypothetical protein P8Y52_03200 [Xanthomonadales bacterium]
MDAMITPRRMLPGLTLVALTLAIFVVTACGPNVIRGRPPFVTLAGLSLEGDRLHAEFGFSNQNGVPMTISATELAVTVRGTDLLRHAETLDLPIDANSAEDVRVEQPVDPFVRTLLVSLDSGELTSLPFDLAGSVQTAEDGTLRFEYTGYLYPVPGRPGQYRSAVTQTRELRAGDPLDTRSN